MTKLVYVRAVTHDSFKRYGTGIGKYMWMDMTDLATALQQRTFYKFLYVKKAKGDKNAVVLYPNSPHMSQKFFIQFFGPAVIP